MKKIKTATEVDFAEYCQHVIREGESGLAGEKVVCLVNMKTTPHSISNYAEHIVPEIAALYPNYRIAFRDFSDQWNELRVLNGKFHEERRWPNWHPTDEEIAAPLEALIAEQEPETDLPVLRVLRASDSDVTVPLPTYGTADAAGADLYANLPADQRAAGLTLAPMQRAVVPTGLRMEIPEGHEVQIRPRSGLASKHGITVLNAPGTIDADYRGPVGVVLINLGAESYTISHGERIAQMVCASVVQLKVRPVLKLSATDRDAGGFGSTGKM